MSGEEREAIKTLVSVTTSLVEFRRDLDHAIYLLRFCRERLEPIRMSNADLVDQLDKFLKERNR